MTTPLGQPKNQGGLGTNLRGPHRREPRPVLATLAQMANRAQLLIDLDLDASPIAGRITSDHDPRRPFHGWLELCSAIEAQRTTAVTTAAQAAPTAASAEDHGTPG